MNHLHTWTDDGVLVALRRRRSVRAGITQAAAIVVGTLLGLALPSIADGPQLDVGTVQPILVAFAGGLLSFIALVYSLLFLVVQYGSTTFTPRLTLFRDDPIVWRTFAVFIGVFVFMVTAALRLGGLDRTSLAVPVAAIALVVVALVLARRLQTRALGHLQLNATLEEVRSRGETIIRALYGRDGAHRSHQPAAPAPSAAPTQVVRWEGPYATLRQLDLPALYRTAIDADTCIRLHVGVGEELHRRSVVMTLHGGRPVDEAVLRSAIDAGTDRTFAQDPLLAFRLLDDIAIRALSTAVNDPATATTAISHVQDLLSLVVDLDLDIGCVTDESGTVRVELQVPSWETFLVAGVDDLLHYAVGVPITNRRLAALLDDLVLAAPPSRRPAIEARRRLVASPPVTHGTDRRSP